MEAILRPSDRLFAHRDAYQTLCRYCKRIFRHLTPPHEYQDPDSVRREEQWHTHHGMRDLMDCAAKCELCRQIMGRFTFMAGNYYYERLGKGESFNEAKIIDFLKQINRVEYRVVKERIQEIWARCVFIDGEPVFSRFEGTKDISFDVFPNSTHTFYSTSDLGPSTSSWGTMELAKTWYQDCKGNHKRCNSHTGSTTILPTRLVEIQYNQARNVMKARLVRGHSLPSNTAYVALSHCWGKARFFNLTEKNYNASMKTFPMEKLPRTFLEAFEITSKLGFHYIWIDSLCIIQDSDDDWKSESSRMGEVYQNAALTLSSSESSSALEGCYKERQSFCLDILTDPWSHRTPMPVNGFRISKRDHYSTSHLVRKTPIHNRGWTIQERALSPRLLHFTHYGIFWECEHCTRSEMAQDGSSHGTTKLTILGRETKEECSVETVWPEIVNQYTHCQLTHPEKDKLVAISGLARTLRNHFPDQYLAGLWRSRLITDLCWSTVAPSAIRPSEYRAPSWSWASIDSCVDMMDVSQIRKNGGEIKPFATITVAETFPVANNEFGQLNGGTLELGCYMLPVRLPRGPIRAMAPEDLLLTGLPRVEFLCKTTRRSCGGGMQDLELDQQNFCSDRDTWCLPILGCVDYDDGFSEGQQQIISDYMIPRIKAKQGEYFCEEDRGVDEITIRNSSEVKETAIPQASNVKIQPEERSESDEEETFGKGSLGDDWDKGEEESEDDYSGDEDDSEDDYSEDEDDSEDDYSEDEDDSEDDYSEDEDSGDDADKEEESRDNFGKEEHDCSEEDGVSKGEDELKRYDTIIFLVIEPAGPKDHKTTLFRRIGLLRVILKEGFSVDTVSFPPEFRREGIRLV